VLNDQGPATRFAFVREGSASGGEIIARLLRQRGTTAETRVTALSDGDAGLRAIPRAAAPEAEPVLDWFHIAMRWQHVHQLASGAIHQGQPDKTRTWLLDRIDRAKWALWNGQLSKTKTLGHLSELRVWTWNVRVDPSWLDHLRTHLRELTCYLDAKADSLPNYGARHHQGAQSPPLCRIGRQRDRVAPDGQAPADAVESGDRSAVSQGSCSRAQRDARGCLPAFGTEHSGRNAETLPGRKAA
jgi:hypothetical protein